MNDDRISIRPFVATANTTISAAEEFQNSNAAAGFEATK